MDVDAGLPAFLREIEGRSAAFESAAKWLSSESLIKVRNWPSIPNSLLVTEIRSWWRERQHGLARQVHEFYDTLGRGIIYPFQLARNKLQGPVVPPMDAYRRDEWGAVLTVVEEVYEKLTWLSDSSDRLLKPFLDQMLAGRSRAQLLEELRHEHEQVDFGRELSQAVDSEMRAFEVGSPELYRFVRQLKNISAAVRPLTSVVLFSIGWGPAAHVLSPMVAPWSIWARTASLPSSPTLRREPRRPSPATRQWPAAQTFSRPASAACRRRSRSGESTGFSPASRNTCSARCPKTYNPPPPFPAPKPS